MKLEGILWLLSGILAFVTIGVGIGAFMSPDFASVAPTLITALAGPLVTAISGLSGVLLSRGVRGAIQSQDTPPDSGGG